MYTTFPATLYKHHNSAYAIAEGIGIKTPRHDALDIDEDGYLSTGKGGVTWITPHDISEIHTLVDEYADAPWFEQHANVMLPLYYVGPNSPCFIETTLTDVEAFISMDDYYLVDTVDELIFEATIDERKTETVRLIGVNEDTAELVSLKTVTSQVGERYVPVIRITSA